MEMSEVGAIAVYKHQWVEVPDTEGDLLLVKESEVPTSVYQAAGDDPLLFLKFANLRPEPGPILAFAEKHGDIGPIFAHKNLPEDTFGTPLSSWKKTIEIIKQLTDAWRENSFDIREQELLNRELNMHGGSCSPGIRRRRGKWLLWLTAYDIYGACLVQLVEVITGNTRVYRCEYCEEPAVRGPNEKRKRKYCSDTCRVKAYRARKENA